MSQDDLRPFKWNESMRQHTRLLTGEMLECLWRIGKHGCDVSKLEGMIGEFLIGKPTSKDEVMEEVKLIREWCDGVRTGKELHAIAVTVFPDARSK